MKDWPLLLSPTWTQLPFEHGFNYATPAGALATIDLKRPVLPASILGLPSACVPAGRDEATGLPIGVLITSRRLREDLRLEAAEVIEARFGVATPIDPVRSMGCRSPLPPAFAQRASEAKLDLADEHAAALTTRVHVGRVTE